MKDEQQNIRLEESEQGGKDKKIVDGLDFLNRS
jgi:hypothetical protein